MFFYVTGIKLLARLVCSFWEKTFHLFLLFFYDSFLVIDLFRLSQWFHSKREEKNTPNRFLSSLIITQVTVVNKFC